jgi:hypothetical protein
VFVTGRSSGGVTFEDYATSAYDAATGAELWVARYNGPGDGNDEANALGVSPDGSTVFVTGASDDPDFHKDYATVAYDAATGGQLWVTRSDAVHGGGAANALGVSPDGSTVFVTGVSGASIDYGTVAYDAATGAQLWATRYNDPGNHDDTALDLGISPDGSAVFVTGYTNGYPDSDEYDTVAYDAASGAQLWVTRYNSRGGNADPTQALGVSPDGSAVFVTGVTGTPDSDDDFATVAYDAASGAKLWVDRAGAGAFTGSSALGVSPTGEAVYVTGYLEGRHTQLVDYATIAYQS